MNLWLGRSAMTFREATLECQDDSSAGLGTLFWRLDHDENSAFVPLEHAEEVKLNSEIHRFSGWVVIHQVLRHETTQSRFSSESNETGHETFGTKKVRIQFSEVALTRRSLLDVCTQELFATLMLSLASHLPLTKTTISQKSGTVRLENKSVNAFLNAFQEVGLGSSTDAMLCVIPALRQKLDPLDPTGLLTALRSSANGYRLAQDWNRAEDIMLWACKRFQPNQKKNERSTTQKSFGRSSPRND